MIGTSNGRPISITGLGCYVPKRVVTNDELSKMVDTSDEWIIERTGIRERRVAAPEEALSDLCLPAARQALEQAGVRAADLDLIIVATVTPDMAFPSTGAIIADGAGAVVLEPSQDEGFVGFELGADGSGGVHLNLPAGGSRLPPTSETVAAEQHFVSMNGREGVKFATRVLVSSAEKLLDECETSMDEVDVYVPHPANVRIIDHAARKLGVPEDRVVVNVDRYGNTSSGSIPLALADAVSDGRLREGKLVLMTGMGAGLTWGSALMRWTANGAGNA